MALPNNTPTRKFRDLSLIFNMHPATHDVVTKTNVDAIKQSIRNLVMTMQYERPFNPHLSSQVFSLLFDNIDVISLNVMRQTVVNVLVQYEPRINLIDVSVDVTNDYHGVYVTVIFSVVNDNTPYEVSVFLDRVR